MKRAGSTLVRVALIAVIAVELVAMLAVVGFRSFGSPKNAEEAALLFTYGVAVGFGHDMEEPLRDVADHHRDGLGSTGRSRLLEKVASTVAVSKTGTDEYRSVATGYALAVTPVTDDPDFADGWVDIVVGVYVEATVDKNTMTAGGCFEIRLAVGQSNMPTSMKSGECEGYWGTDGRPVPTYLLVF